MRRLNPTKLQSKHRYLECDVRRNVCICFHYNTFYKNQNLFTRRWSRKALKIPTFSGKYVLWIFCYIEIDIQNYLCLSLCIYLPFSGTVFSGCELLASAGDEWWAHRAALPALFSLRLGTSCPSHRHPGYCFARWFWVDHSCCVWTGAWRCVSRKKICKTSEYIWVDIQ